MASLKSVALSTGVSVWAIE